MLVSASLAVASVLSTAYLHLAVLRWCSGGMAAIPLAPMTRALMVTALLFAAHMVEIALYAGAYALADQGFSAGGFAGEPMAAPLDYLYFSAITYTSLGIGDIFPTGHLRFLTGVEALNGLLLIAWSASFLFAMMNRLWDWQPCKEPYRPRRQ